MLNLPSRCLKVKRKSCFVGFCMKQKENGTTKLEMLKITAKCLENLRACNRFYSLPELTEEKVHKIYYLVIYVIFCFTLKAYTHIRLHNIFFHICFNTKQTVFFFFFLINRSCYITSTASIVLLHPLWRERLVSIVTIVKVEWVLKHNQMTGTFLPRNFSSTLRLHIKYLSNFKNGLKYLALIIIAYCQAISWRKKNLRK